MSDPLQPHELQHARLSCPSLSSGVCSNSCPLSQWCHPVSSSVVLFSSCPQSFLTLIYLHILYSYINNLRYADYSILMVYLIFLYQQHSSFYINNLRYADNTTLMAESEEELKSFLMRMREEREKAGLKLNIQKTKIMVSDPIISW